MRTTATNRTAAAANIRATAIGGLRTGLTALRNTAPAPVTVWVGDGPTSLPRTLDGIKPAAHAPLRQPTVYGPGSVSPFAPKPRTVAPVAPKPVAKRATRIAACRFDDSRYERSHGKAPRGRGLWLFERSKGQPVFEHNGTLSQAKAAARAWAKAQGFGTTATGCVLLYVCP